MPANGDALPAARFEMLVALRITDQEAYASYRAAMRPLLEAAGGGFRFDCEVARVLKGAPDGINRLFAIEFPSRTAADQFFADPEYVAIRGRWFTQAVADVTILAQYTLGPE